MVVELAKDELTYMFKVWLSTFLSLSYCHFIGKITSKGFTRLIAILPVIILFLILPLNITSVHFCGFTAFFISWLANFKLLLFAFGKPPLSFDSPISYTLFLTVACLPIKMQHSPSPKTSSKWKIDQNPHHKPENNSYPNSINSSKPQNKQDPDQKALNKSHPSSQNLPKTYWNYLIKGSLLVAMVKIYDYSDHIHPKLLWLIYFFHMYFGIEITLAMLAKAANFYIGLELEPQFNEPLLSTSLQDFWGKRWNLMATSILRPTVYLPAQDFFAKFIDHKIASLAAVMTTFIVSAIMHELIFYYLVRVVPSFEVTWFFLLHGFCLCLEITVKKYGRDRKWWIPPRWLSGFVTVGFVVGTGFWLFLPPLLNAELPTRGLAEYAVVGEFFRHIMMF